MADFLRGLDHVMKLEGGYQLINVTHDRGGQTYAGISRKFNPDWPGWERIDSGEQMSDALTMMVQKLYRDKYWEPMSLGEIEKQDIANMIFSAAVVSGVPTATKLVQGIVLVSRDGVWGPRTTAALRERLDTPEKQDFFKATFALAQIFRFRGIVARNRDQGKFLLGWINRIFEEFS